MEKIAPKQAAELLGVSAAQLTILEKNGVIHPAYNADGTSLYSTEEITRIKSRPGMSLSEEATQVGIKIQGEIASSVSFTRKVLIASGGAIAIYVLLILVFAILFIARPLPTARWLGIVKTKTNIPLATGNHSQRVLGVITSSIPEKNSPVQAALQPIGKVALGLVKNISPSAYAEVSNVAILDTSEVLGLDTSGAITPERPINLPDSSFLQVGGNQVIANLNSQYLQGRQPGTQVGDLAIVGESPSPTPTLIPTPTPTPVPTTPAPTPTPTFVPAPSTNANTATNFTGSLAGDVTGTQNVTTVEKINGAVLGATTASSGHLLLGNGSSWESQALSGDVTVNETGDTTLKNTGTAGTYGSGNEIPVLITDAQGRISSVLNTVISGLTAGNFAAGDFSDKIISGLYSINISGNAASATHATSADTATTATSATTATTATNFTGSLAGDVTGTQGSTVLKNTGTAGTYGSGNEIPVLVTDAQGRVASATQTTISGLTADNLTAGDFSSKINSGTYDIDITGNAASATATNFTGSLAGDVTGTQNVTTVEKINGAALGATTAASGHLLVGNGLSWESQALSGDVTVNGTGDTTLKNTGTAGTYGSGNEIPVFVTDAQGRISSVLNTVISGLTAGNLSGVAGITNGQLANSLVTILTGNGLSGGGAVSLGGSVSLANTGVTSLTGTTNQVNTSSSTGAITLSLPQNIHTAANPTFAGLNLSGLTNCGELTTNASGTIQCDGATGDTATFSDTTPATIADNNTTELFNDATKPSLTPNTTNQTILVTVHARFTGGGANDTDAAVRIVRNIGSSASCSTSPQVGDTFSAFMTNNTDIGDAAGTFLDSPATTSQVFYTVCSSSNSVLGSAPTSNRIDVTLVELGADLAENYYTTDNSIKAGDVVVIDSSLPTGVKKSSKQYDNQIIGIVSTNPGQVLDDALGLNLGRAIPIALAGRVPVKVSTENGLIKPGDSLTSSSTPGVAMKATGNGSIIGMALTEYSGTDIGSVLTFIKSGFSTTPPENSPPQDNASLLTTITDTIANTFHNLVEFFGNVIFHANVTFLGRPTFNKDTAGHASIKAGNNEVEVNFEKEYTEKPVVTASINLADDTQIDEIPAYAIYDLSTKGFKIKLSHETVSDLTFSWIALSVPDNSQSDHSVPSGTNNTPSTTPVASQTPSLAATPLPSNENKPTENYQVGTVNKDTALSPSPLTP